MKSGFLKRLWLVVCVPWTMFWLLFLPEVRPSGFVGFAVLVLLPWLGGPLAVWIVRFLMYGSVAKPAIKSQAPPQKVDAEWADD